MHANLWLFMILHQILVFLMYPTSHTLRNIWNWSYCLYGIMDNPGWTCCTYFSCPKTTHLIINTYFQVFEIKNDAQMKRTMRRPLPSGRISPAHAAMWATSVGVAGTALLAWKVLGFSLHSIDVYSTFFWNLLSCEVDRKLTLELNMQKIGKVCAG